jgi:hypothetical protein
MGIRDGSGSGTAGCCWAALSLSMLPWRFGSMTLPW